MTQQFAPVSECLFMVRETVITDTLTFCEISPYKRPTFKCYDGLSLLNINCLFQAIFVEGVVGNPEKWEQLFWNVHYFSVLDNFTFFFLTCPF